LRDEIAEPCVKSAYKLLRARVKNMNHITKAVRAHEQTKKNV
jgi:hypothetical protein